MKPASFELAIAESVDHASALLAENGPDAKILSGGQSLGPLLNLRLAFPDLLVDINRLSTLSGTNLDAQGNLEIGALTRHRNVETSEAVASRWSILARAAGQIGHISIRNRGTIGGSVAHADPAAEYPSVLVALDARIVLVSRRGAREVPAAEFFRGPFTTTAEPDELVTAIRIQDRLGHEAQAWMEFCRRTGDFGIVGVAAVVRVDPDGSCLSGRLVYSGVDSKPWESSSASQYLQAARLSEDAIREVSEIAASESDPVADDHASASFRRHLIRELTQRALIECLHNTKGSKRYSNDDR
ncbi:MAG: xanthine dehydrogenase family protein subunit M [Acidimicrobiia bacterium]